MVWNAAVPAGTDFISAGDDVIRELKTDLAAALSAQGSFPGADTANPEYKWTPEYGNTASRPSSDLVTGQLYLNTEVKALQRYNGATWDNVDMVQSATIDENDLAASVAGSGLAGGAGTALSVGVDNSTVEISSDQVRVKDGLTIQTVNVGTALQYKTFASLPILQVVTARTVSEATSISTSYGDTNLTGSITPKLNTSKILVFASGTAHMPSGDNAYYTVARDGTNLATTDKGLATVPASSTNNLCMVVYDSPATTSSTTYTVRFRVSGGTATTRFPYSAGGLGASDATLYLVEVAQ